MSVADYIVVLDTGSTDGSFEKLKADPRVTRVEQTTINPWRFDVARNESMKLVPEDTDIYVCTDFDELFENKNWCDILRQHWKPDDDRCHYTYAWSHNDLGEPQDVFKYDKIHTKDYYWKFPVHEVLYPKDLSKVERVLDAGEYIYLHHWQDLNKPRRYYFDLLELAVEENPDNSHVRMLLAREYLLRQDYANALKEYEKCLEYDDIKLPNMKSVRLETLGRIADLYAWNEKEPYTAIKYYLEFIKLDPTYREPYFCMADVYIAMGLYTLAIGCVESGLKYTYQHYDWVERKDNWISKGNELLLYAYKGLKDYPNAI